MNVAVIDVGSDAARLLVAEADGRTVTPLREERTYLALGEEIALLGRVSCEKLKEISSVAGGYARVAERAGADVVEVVVTAPGRQAANAQELVEALLAATRSPTRVLSADDEGRLAYEGAIARAGPLPELVGVCDVGGNATQLIVGTPGTGPAWLRSFDIGALRLTSTFLPSDPPEPHELKGARSEVVGHFTPFTAPLPKAVLATGGCVRGLGKLVGPTLDQKHLETAARMLARRPSAKIAQTYGLDLPRARLLPAAALILMEVVRRVGIPVDVARGGVREGAAVALAAGRRAA